MRVYFQNLYGNDSLKERLGKAVESSTLPHAFLITGDECSGKKTLTLEISAALNCENKNNPKFALPCCKCNTCKRIFDGNYIDIKRLKKSDNKATVGVEEVRIFRSDMYLSSTESSYKIYIIEDADKLTTNAQNALLTVLEEPPSNVVIFLLAKTSDKILTTIKSRTQCISMQLFEKNELKEYLLRDERAILLEKVSPSLLNDVIMSSGGKIGTALNLLSSKKAESTAEERRTTEQIIYAMKPGVSFTKVHSALSKLPQSKAEFSEQLEVLVTAIRDIIIVRLSEKSPLVFFSSHTDALTLASAMDTKRLIKLYDIISEAITDLGKNVTVSTIISDISAKIKLL